jgi:hypothetical protein
VEVAFLNAVKEADALKHRRSVVHQLQEMEHRQLWFGLLNGKVLISLSSHSSQFLSRGFQLFALSKQTQKMTSSLQIGTTSSGQ